jgi:hypothetical protein
MPPDFEIVLSCFTCLPFSLIEPVYQIIADQTNGVPTTPECSNMADMWLKE